MTTKSREFTKGIRLKPTTDAATLEGEERVDSSDNKKKVYLDSSERAVVTEDQTQTLENKTIDATAATGNNTLSADASDIEYDNGASGLTATDAQAAIDELKTITDNQDEASEISYDNSTSGLAATNVQDAIDEVDGNLDTHIGATSAHGTTGDVVGTSDTQTLTNKTIDADLNTISNIDNNDIKASAAIDATKIADGSVDNTEFQYLDGVTSDIQPQLDGKLSGVGATTDNVLIRTDGTSGNSIQDSNIVVSDADAMSGLTQLDVDNVQIDGNTISSTDTNGDINISPDGTGATVINSDNQITGSVIRDVADDSTSGSNVTLATPAVKNIRLTSGTLESIDMIPAGTDGQEIVIINVTGDSLEVNDNTGATAANRILTGTKATIQLADEASLRLAYDATESRWMIIGGTGSGSGEGINFASPIGDMETAKTSDFTTSGGTLTITTTPSEVGRGTRSVKHVATAASESFTSTNIAIPQGYRGEILLFKGVYKSDQERTLTIRDVTNAEDFITIDIPATGSDWGRIRQEIQLKFTTEEVTYSFESSAADTFLLDDVILNDDNLIGNVTLVEYYRATTNGGRGSTNTAIPYWNTEQENTMSAVGTVENNSTDGWSFTAKRRCRVTMSYNMSYSASNHYGISKNSTQLTTNFAAVTEADKVAAGRSSSSNQEVPAVFTGILEEGDVLRPHVDPGSATISVANRSIITIKAEADTLRDTEANQIMQENEYSINILNNGSVSIQSQGPSNWLESGDITRNSTGNITIDYTSLGLTDVPGYNLSVQNDRLITVDSISTTSITIQTQASATNNAVDEDFCFELTKHDNDYTPISRNIIASEKPTAFIKDVKSSGTQGGTFTGGSWQTRDLNDLSGDDYFISLSSNQVTLKPGSYWISASAPAHGSGGNEPNNHKTKIRNITDSTDDLIGTSERINLGSGIAITNRSFVEGYIEIDSEKTYELQHRCSSTFATSGFGEASNFGVDEVYAQVTIVKLK